MQIDVLQSNCEMLCVLTSLSLLNRTPAHYERLLLFYFSLFGGISGSDSYLDACKKSSRLPSIQILHGYKGWSH